LEVVRFLDEVPAAAPSIKDPPAVAVLLIAALTTNPRPVYRALSAPRRPG
jgi:hypothetical protein